MLFDKRFAILGFSIAMSGLLPTTAAAQGALGSIAGVVRDATGGVLPGVTVEAASPALIEKTRAVVSDDQGVYKIIDLRPGTYQVTFGLAGFNTVRREGIELVANFTAQVNAELRVGSIEETITVSGNSPIIDVQNVVQQKVMSRELMDALPTNKTFGNLAALVPGMVVSGGQDVGGSAADRSISLTIHGSRPNESQIEIDGMPIHNGLARGGGMFGFYLNNGMAQEMSIQTDGMSAELEVSGVRNNVIPKEGGNVFRGIIFGNYTGERLVSDNLSDDLIGRGLTAVNSVKKIWDANPAFGGPIAQDRLWFYTAFRHWGTYNYVAGLYENSTPLSFTPTPDTSKQAVDNIYHVSQDVRLTSQVSPRNKVNLFYEFQYSLFGRAYGPSAVISPEAYGYYRHRPQYLGQLTWSSPLTSRFLVEAGATLSANDYHGYRQPGVTSVVTAVIDQGRNLTYRASPGAYGFNRSNNYNYRASASYVTGTHSFKAGMFLMHTWGYQTTEVNNNMNFTFTNGVPSAVQIFATPIEYREKIKYNLGLYAQDQWALRRFTFNLGVRSDMLNAFVDEQQLPAGQFVPARNFARVDDVPNWKDISPRLGVSFDVFGNGRTAVKASLGRYMVAMVLNQFTRLANPVFSSVNNASRTWRDDNRNFFPDCQLGAIEENSECGPLLNRAFGSVQVRTRYDETLTNGSNVRPDNWNASVSVQHELVRNVSLNAGYFRRWYGHFTATQNLDTAATDYDPYCVPVPSDSRLPGGGSSLCGFFDVKPALVGRINNLVAQASEFGTQREVYDGLDLGVTARIPRGVTLAGGLNTGRTRTNNCYMVSRPDLTYPGTAAGVTSPRANAFCDVKPPFLTQVKGYAVYPLPWWGLQASGTFQSLPGPMITASYVAQNRDIVPTLGRNLSAGSTATVLVDLIPPGTMYGERLYQTDLRVTKVFMFGNKRLQGMFDMYNVSNANPVLTLNTRHGAAWLRPLSILNGRLFKFGAQINF